ncbi:hypothetical protein A3Q56_01133 [Intoshia linei]|uniref:Myotubularin phosphatase domain-containing protein n=1 Tax=Intoshia linei TaxID=1819745 RepID=A0A177B9W2_9BILA|nr:hypothetical protein A3Q56_01133 [Intoshia linei]
MNDVDQITTKELYPMKKTCVDDESIDSLPYKLLCGEYVEYIGKATNDTIAITNYRFTICGKRSCRSIPLGLIESVISENLMIRINLITIPVITIDFKQFESQQLWLSRFNKIAEGCEKIQDAFAFYLHAWCSDQCFTFKSNHYRDVRYPKSSSSTITDNDFSNKNTNDINFERECKRMKFIPSRSWRVSDFNMNQKMVPTYPDKVIVPTSVTDAIIKQASVFRTKARFPSVVWRDVETGNVVVRSSQPQTGIVGWRNNNDENFLNAISIACHADRLLSNIKPPAFCRKGPDGKTEPAYTMIFMDLRTYTAAVANRAKGGGTEIAEYYKFAKIMYRNIPNIHSVKNQFSALRSALYSTLMNDQNYLINVGTSWWLQTVSNILETAMCGAKAIRIDKVPIFVHCSDGWDRTAQIASLIELMLDPYHRTIEGFNILVDREWCQYGHKFADRVGSGARKGTILELSPIFIQWLDCVYQLLKQFPREFEFNQYFLIKYAVHAHSNLFGNFLCNSISERRKNNCITQTLSLFDYLTNNESELLNPLYKPNRTQTALWVKHDVKYMHLWTGLYRDDNSYSTVISHIKRKDLCFYNTSDHEQLNTSYDINLKNCQEKVTSLVITLNDDNTTDDPSITNTENTSYNFNLPKEIYNNVYDQHNKHISNLLRPSKSIEDIYNMVDDFEEEFMSEYNVSVTSSLNLESYMQTLSFESDESVKLITPPVIIPDNESNFNKMTPYKFKKACSLNLPIETDINVSKNSSNRSSPSSLQIIPQLNEEIPNCQIQCTNANLVANLRYIPDKWSPFFDRDGLILNQNIMRDFVTESNQKYENQISIIQKELNHVRHLVKHLFYKNNNK